MDIGAKIALEVVITFGCVYWVILAILLNDTVKTKVITIIINVVIIATTYIVCNVLKEGRTIMDDNYIYVIVVSCDEESDTAECAFSNLEDAKNYVKDRGFKIEELEDYGEEDREWIQEDITQYGYYCVKENPHEYCFIKKVKIYTQRVKMAKWKVDIFDKDDDEYLETDYVIANADYSWDDIIKDRFYIPPYKTNVRPTRIG